MCLTLGVGGPTGRWFCQPKTKAPRNLNQKPCLRETRKDRHKRLTTNIHPDPVSEHGETLNVLPLSTTECSNVTAWLIQKNSARYLESLHLNRIRQDTPLACCGAIRRGGYSMQGLPCGHDGDWPPRPFMHVGTEYPADRYP